MKSYFGGQIKEELRGDLAALVLLRSEQQNYEANSYPLCSPEFVAATSSEAAIRWPIERVYLGINNAAVKRVEEAVARHTSNQNGSQKRKSKRGTTPLEILLSNLDGQLVDPTFRF